MNTPQLIQAWYEGLRGEVFSKNIGTIVLRNEGIYYKQTYRAYTLTTSDLTVEWEVIRQEGTS